MNANQTAVSVVCVPDIAEAFEQRLGFERLLADLSEYERDHESYAITQVTMTLQERAYTSLIQCTPQS